jgi:hypothetical protein
MRRFWLNILALLWGGGVLYAALQAAGDPFLFFSPSLVITQEERRRLDRGQVLVRVLPGQEREIAVFSAAAFDRGGEALVQGVRRIEELKRGPYVLAIGRFSDPPGIGDLAGLSLDEEDLQSIRECRLADCAVKLSGPEMEQLRRAAEPGAKWKSSLQEAFRSLVLERVLTYKARGHEGISGYQDTRTPVDLKVEFSGIVRNSPYLVERMPQFAAYLQGYPRIQAPAPESFFYWSKEKIGRKPVISVTHVSIMRGENRADLPEVLVAGKQVFATHYMNGALALTAVVGGRDGAPRYLAYLNRSRVDMLGGGVFGWVKRTIVEQRLEDETEKIFLALRDRLRSFGTGAK